MSDWRVKQSFASTSPSGPGCLVYIESHARDARRQRCTCLSELGNTPLACVEHTDVIAVVAANFTTDNNTHQQSGGGGGGAATSTWLCVFHGEEHVDTVGRSAMGGGASIMTSYPLCEGDGAPRVSPLFGVKVRAARPGVSGAYVFGTPPSTWKVPLATRAQSIVGTWVGCSGAAAAAMMMSATMAMSGSTAAPGASASASGFGGVAPPLHFDDLCPDDAATVASGVSGSNNNNDTSLSGCANVLAWCVLSPYALAPIFVCGLCPDLDGAVIAEFIVPGDATIVAFMSTRGVLRMFAVEVAVGGDALIWHVIRGEYRLPAELAAAESCDEVQCEVLPSSDPLRHLLCLRLPRSQTVIVLETQPLRTEDAFFPLDTGSGSIIGSHSQQQQQQHDNNSDGNSNSNHMSEYRRGPPPFAAHGRGNGGSQLSASGGSRRASSASSRSASQLTQHDAHSSAGHATHMRMMHESPSPSRGGFVCVQTMHNIVALLRWAPVRGFAPFVVALQSQAVQLSSSSSSSAAAATAPAVVVATVLARGPPFQPLESVATFQLAGSAGRGGGAAAAAAAASGNSGAGGVAIDGCHATRPSRLLGAFVMTRDRATSMWAVDQSLPHIARSSVDFLALCTLCSVLPQHQEALYRHCVAGLLRDRSAGVLDVVASFLLSGTSAAAEAKENIPRPSRSHTLFSPWHSRQRASHGAPATTAAAADGACPGACAPTPTPTLAPQSLRLAALALHLLVESLKVHRVYGMQIGAVSRLVLRLADAAAMPRFASLYRDALLASCGGADAPSAVATNAAASAAAQGVRPLVSVELAAQFFEDLVASSVPEHRCGDAAAAAGASLPSGGGQAALGALDGTPLDLLACLRWMSEGIAPPVARWPRVGDPAFPRRTQTGEDMHAKR